MALRLLGAVMSISPNDILDTSKYLLKDNNESNLRSASSRAYYAAFHACSCFSEKLPAVDMSGKHETTHNVVITKYLKYTENSDFKIKIRKVGGLMMQLRNARVDADYKLSFNFKEPRAKENVYQSGRIIGMIDDLTKDFCEG